MMSSRSSRAPSFSSDRPSVASSVTFQMPSSVRPPPAYIAASVASQMVTDHHNAQLRLEDAEHEELENAVFSEQALALLNAFLDHLLFAFLSSARSPALSAIRPAIADVLKPRLAREATEAADEELEGLLAGEEEEEDIPAQDGRALDKWDVERVWKRTRLRIMVYTRLGELEDEDEERFVQQERGLSMDSDDEEKAGLVSWASAIFLTSVVEYVAEQTLLVAGSAAFARMAAKMRKLAELENMEQSFGRLVIEEPDVEKIALNSALGRLWRTWRKRVRSPSSPMSPGRGIRPVSSLSSLHHRKASFDTLHDPFPIPERTPTETEIAANIPLPVGANDVHEIEVPGLARTYEDNESPGTQTPVPRNKRPTSVFMLDPVESWSARHGKARPLSMPVPAALPFSVPPLFSSKRPESRDMETPFETAMENPNRRSYMGNGSQPDLPIPAQLDGQHSPGESPQEADADMMAFAASTGMGFRMGAADTLPIEHSDTSDDDDEMPVVQERPTIMQSKRMSVEKITSPGLVRTYSARSSSLRSSQNTPVATPKIPQQAEGRSYLDDTQSDDEDYGQRAIGVARTSNVPIQSAPTPPIEQPVDKGKQTANGGYVEVQPRQTAPTSISVRNSPTPDAKPIVPERSVARKEPHRREIPSEDFGAVASNGVNTFTPPRRDTSTPRSHNASMPSLKEVDSYPNTAGPAVATRNGTARHGHSPSSQQGSVSHPAAERQLPRKSVEASLRGPADTSPSSDKAGVQRVASNSSKKSGSINGRPSRGESESGQRPHMLRGRMSEEDRQRHFESLVNGEETVKFTLTPQTVRGFEVSRLALSLHWMLTYAGGALACAAQG
jgi:hypothetical protein